MPFWVLEGLGGFNLDQCQLELLVNFFRSPYILACCQCSLWELSASSNEQSTKGGGCESVPRDIAVLLLDYPTTMAVVVCLV
jgi:hypothetical protein